MHNQLALVTMVQLSKLPIGTYRRQDSKHDHLFRVLLLVSQNSCKYVEQLGNTELQAAM